MYTSFYNSIAKNNNISNCINIQYCKTVDTDGKNDFVKVSKNLLRYESENNFV